jgi:hypothetical protein
MTFMEALSVPMGIGAYALVGVLFAVVITLLVLGARKLFFSTLFLFEEESERPEFRRSRLNKRDVPNPDQWKRAGQD